MFIWVSMHDILSIPQLREAVVIDDMGLLYEALYEAGFDINDEVDWQVCYHRRLNKEIVYGVRLFSRERTDKEWLASGNASLEARKVAVGRTDPSFLRELDNMSRESNFMGQLVDHLESYWGGEGNCTSSIEISNI